jgi:hypothetical protein
VQSRRPVGIRSRCGLDQTLDQGIDTLRAIERQQPVPEVADPPLQAQLEELDPVLGQAAECITSGGGQRGHVCILLHTELCA